MPDADMITIDDDNFQQFINPIAGGERRMGGYLGMWEPGVASGAAGGFGELGIPLIDEDEWSDRARERERNGTRIKDLCQEMGLEVLNQNGTNYCWINGPAYCAMIIRLQETGLEYRYSPASAGARIKNFRNVGGWGSQGLNWMRSNGINLQSDWPANAIRRSYNTDSNQTKAKRHRVLEYYKLSSGRNGWREVVSCLLAGVPVAVGYNWWSHEVTATDINPAGELIIANSWGNWGDRGFGVLKGSRRYPDDAVAITAMAPI